MMESGDILEQSYQGDGKIKGEIDKKLELAKAVVEFERTNTFIAQDKSPAKNVEVDIDAMLLDREARMRAGNAPKENNTLRDIFLALLFLVTLPTFVIPLGIIIYLGVENKKNQTGCSEDSDNWGIGNTLGDRWAS